MQSALSTGKCPRRRQSSLRFALHSRFVQQPGDAVARDPVHAAEVASQHNLPVPLHRHAKDGVVRARVEAGIERTVGVEPGELGLLLAALRVSSFLLRIVIAG